MSSVRSTTSHTTLAGRFRDLSRGSYYLKSSSRSESHVASGGRPRRARSVATAQPAARRQTKSQVLQRTVTTAPKITAKRHRTAKPHGQKLMLAMASLVFMFGIGVALVGLRTNKAVEAQVQSTVEKIQNQTNPVDEQKPSQAELGAYTVGPTAPRYVRINKIRVFARVQKQGLDGSGAVKAPGNVHDAGWYKDSSRPGEAGAMLLDGHVAGPTTPGVFTDIKKLQAGDTIEIERGDGQRFTYSVVKSETTPADQTNMTAALLSAEPGRPALNLITCTGKYNAETGQYDDRIVVYAVQI